MEVKTIAQNVVNYVLTAPLTYLVLLALAINPFQRHAFFQIADVQLDFMIITLHKRIARVITSREKKKIIFHIFIYI